MTAPAPANDHKTPSGWYRPHARPVKWYRSRAQLWRLGAFATFVIVAVFIGRIFVG